MGARRYVILDVFTSSPLEGNPLAVVLDCDGLDTAAMLKIAGEFNLSETVFVLPPEDEMQTARIRIFTPAYEMPFAGHPTVGTAVALAVERGLQDAAEVVLGENIGPVRCVVSSVDGLMGARFEVPKLPERLAFDADTAAISEALGLEESEIGMDGHEIAVWSAGVPYVTVPVSGLAAAGRVRFDTHRWAALAPAKSADAFASAYVYCRETVETETNFHARMFVTGGSPYEDPATGSAAAAFIGQAVACEKFGDGTTRLSIEQGMEMGRPSRIGVDIDVADGRADAARIGGSAVIVAQGTLLV